MVDFIDGIPPGNGPPPPQPPGGDDKKPEKNEGPNIPVGQDKVTISEEARVKCKEISDQEIEITVKIKVPAVHPKVINNYQNNITQISDSTIIQTINSNLPALADELPKLRKAMLKRATEPDHYRAIADIAEAEKAAKSGNAQRTIEFMKKLGKETIKVARDISVNLTAEFLKRLLMPN